MKYYVSLLLVIGLLNNVVSQSKKDTLRVLFVGNSYAFTSNTPHLVSLLSDSTSTKLETSKSAAGSATLKDHWTNKSGLKTKQAIKSGLYDVVVIQGHSMETIDRKEEFLKYSKKLCDLAVANSVKPYLYVTWGRQKVPQYQLTISEVYKEAAQNNNCELVLIGEAWNLARRLRPDISLFKTDGSHPMPLGAFLSACVLVNTLSSTLPEHLPNWYFTKDQSGEQITLLMEDPLDIIFCLKVASEITSKETGITD